MRSGLAYLGSGVLAYGVSGLAYFSVRSAPQRDYSYQIAYLASGLVCVSV